MTATGRTVVEAPLRRLRHRGRADALRSRRGPAGKARRRGFFERFATARQARIGHEIFVGVERLFARRGLDAHRGAVRQEVPALLVVLEIRHHDLVEHLLVHGGIEDRTEHLDAAVEIARHHVGGGDVDRGLADAAGRGRRRNNRCGRVRGSGRRWT